MLRYPEDSTPEPLGPDSADSIFEAKSGGLHARDPRTLACASGADNYVDWDEMGRRILAEALRRTIDDLWREERRSASVGGSDETAEDMP